MGSKRASERELEEIEVDVHAPKPLNKKQKRLLKKGKIEPPKPEDPDAAKPKPRSPFAVWIGNLSFETTADTLRQFVVEKTADLAEPIRKDDITRVKLPPKKGFAYVDVKTEAQMNELVALSESRLDGRNLLIKSASSFEGRPAEHAEGQKNPPSRVLFVGNLSFDTTDEQLQQHFQHCGDIQRIRTATFQDTGNCKGFSFVDFRTEEAATKALKDASCRRLNGRSLRMEYGEDRSKRRPKLAGVDAAEAGAGAGAGGAVAGEEPQPRRAARAEPFLADERPARKPAAKKVGKARPTPGAALAGAARSKQAILPSAGKKVTFN